MPRDTLTCPGYEKFCRSEHLVPEPFSIGCPGRKEGSDFFLEEFSCDPLTYTLQKGVCT